MTRALVHAQPEWKVEWKGKNMLAHTERNGWRVMVRSDEMAAEALALILVGVGIIDGHAEDDGVASGHMTDQVHDDFMALVSKYGWEVDVLDDITAEGGENDNADTELDPGACAQGSSCREAEARRADINAPEGVGADGSGEIDDLVELVRRATEARSQRGGSATDRQSAEEALGGAQEAAGSRSQSSQEASGEEVVSGGPDRSGPLVISEWRRA